MCKKIESKNIRDRTRSAFMKLGVKEELQTSNWNAERRSRTHAQWCGGDQEQMEGIQHVIVPWRSSGAIGVSNYALRTRTISKGYLHVLHQLQQGIWLCESETLDHVTKHGYTRTTSCTNWPRSNSSNKTREIELFRIRIRRGVRQGCILTPNLFNLYVGKKSSGKQGYMTRNMRTWKAVENSSTIFTMLMIRLYNLKAKTICCSPRSKTMKRWKWACISTWRRELFITTKPEIFTFDGEEIKIADDINLPGSVKKWQAGKKSADEML